ncbi:MULTISPECIES: cysteine desulfurase NifS [unclassified Pseudodesulfovibrio]|uniref:cysteine desulfurase NifS n=1 Tax=unclassified Pseudodesulfovibrio TaxID=2661612 RepID=UPI000FEBBDA7|nr:MULTISPECIES: cysteine desulfurase NifS [unclassified Pseudodesulfovibrio]MCJ2163783.1 cysteine desulfurase NifS [Pseudodesulfovibrio sp. S3-i]RWU05968.1 cysteine desulfurase NifS [Pseudodesulfovibrio sp. S3]
MKTIYLDNNATTQVDPVVFETMQPFFTELYGNPSSMHRFGGQVGAKLKEARASVAAILGCEPSEIIFTSCGSESDNTAIRSALNAQPDKRHIITSAVEHPAVLSFCKFLEKKEGYDVTYLGTDEYGRLNLEEYEAAFRPDTAIVSIMWANNETGNIYPIGKMAQTAKQNGVFFHTDAVQAVGKVPIDLKSVPVDMLSLSGHKLHAPKGVGALFVRKKLPFRPLLIGGHQEGSRRAGTENTTGIIALGKACELALAHMDEENTEVRRLRDKLETGLLNAIPDSILNGDRDNRLPNTSNISFGYVEGEAILLMMDQLGIAASSGSACTSGSLEPSHVLRAMGVPFTFAHGSIRFSLSRFNTEEEVDFVIETLPAIIKNLRKLSPFSAEKSAPACTKSFSE